MKRNYIMVVGLIILLSSQLISQEKRAFRNTWVNTGVGLSIRSIDASFVSQNLPSGTPALSNTLVGFTYHGAFEFKNGIRLIGDLNTSLSLPKSQNNVRYFQTLSSGGLGFGYKIIQKDRFNLSLNGVLSADAYTLRVSEDKSSATFTEALSKRTETTLNAFNFNQFLFGRFEYTFNARDDEFVKSRNNIALDLGYNFARPVSWSDSSLNEITGPELNNSGFMFRLLFTSSLRMTKRIKN